MGWDDIERIWQETKVDGPDLEATSSPSPGYDEIADLPLPEFTLSGCAVVVNSFLGRVCFAADDHVAAKMRAEGFVVYTADELERIVNKQLTRDELQHIHEIKCVFSGSKVKQ